MKIFINFCVTSELKLLFFLWFLQDSPEQGVLYMLRTLLDTVEKLSFEPESGCLARIYLLMLDILLTSTREKYPYHIPNVISNDELYGSDPKFINEVHSMCSQMVESILYQLKLLGNGNNSKAQCQYTLDLFLKLALHSNIGVERTFTLTLNLWNLAMKNRKLIEVKIPGKMLMKVENHMKAIGDPQLRHAFEELTSKMKVKM